MANLTGTDMHRDRILKAALNLLSKQGRDAVTTRNVAEAAKVQPPVLYRIFGDKAGLLDAAAAYGFKRYLGKKRPPLSNDDPVEALRTGWDLHVEFGLEIPDLFLLMYANPRPGVESPAAQQASRMLWTHMHSVAAAGRLRIGVDRACGLYHAAAVGIMMSLLALPPGARDLSLSSAARDQSLSALTTWTPAISPPTAAILSNTLHALMLERGESIRGFTNGERLLFLEWLKRLVDQEDG